MSNGRFRLQYRKDFVSLSVKAIKKRDFVNKKLHFTGVVRTGGLLKRGNDQQTGIHFVATTIAV